MKAILIDPWQRSLETIELQSGYDTVALEALYKLVGEEGLDAAYIMPGESILVGDHSALADPPLASYSVEGYKHRLYGKGVVIGYNRYGKERSTRLSVDQLSKLISFD
jgi:hypothetical protein